MPQMVADGRASNSVAHGWSPVASHFIALTLMPGETKDLIFVLGYVENEADEKFNADGTINKARAHALQAALADNEKVEFELKKLNDFWNGMLANFQMKSTDARLDRMVNTWNQYQTMITYFFSRSTSYFESGIGRGMGFRDSNQDICGMVHLQPEWARQRIIDLASTQLADGGAYHQYQPSRKRETVILEEILTTTRFGLSSQCQPTSKKRATGRCSMPQLPSTTRAKIFLFSNI